MKDYKNITSLISGASSGIGLGLAKALVGQGARVAITGTNDAKLAAASAALAAGGAKVLALKFDVADEVAWRDAARRVESELGPIQFLGLNAGIGMTGRAIESTPTAAWRTSIDINFMGVVHGLQACLPGMKAAGLPGHVMITSSIGGVITTQGGGAYNAIKAAVIALAEVLRTELAATLLTASVLCPQAVRTDLPNNSNRRSPGSMPEAALGRINAMLELGLDPSDVGTYALERIRAGDFYIFTHNVGEDVAAARFEGMRAAMRLGAIVHAVPPRPALE